MLQRLKSFLAPQRPPSRLELASSLDLDGKPFARALILRAAEYQDDAIRDIASQIGRTTIPDSLSIEAFAASSASSIAYHVTVEAAKRQERTAVFLPGEDIPKDAPLIVAFSLLVLSGIHGQLTTEGLDLPFTQLAAETANLFFLAHPDEERIKYATRGIAAFHAFAHSDAKGVAWMHERLMELIPMYVLQWTSDNSELKQADFISLFGRLLRSLLKASE